MRVKKMLFGCAFILLIIGVCELASYAGLAFFLKTYNVRERTGVLMRFAQHYPMVMLGPSYDVPDDVMRGQNVLHPYLGYVREPLLRQEVTNVGNEPMNSYGFSEIGGSIVRVPSKDEVVIGIFGGSLAERLAYNAVAQKMLGDAVTSIPRYKGKKPVFTVAALAGYKQPQQLMAYNYLLSLGAHFDVIITLDGFNEVTLSLVENVPKNIYSVYPRGWRQLSSTSDPATHTLSYDLAEKRSLFSALMQSRPVRWSMTSRLLWIMLDASYERRIIISEMHPYKKEASMKPFAMSGPVSADTSVEAVQRLSTDVWSRSIMQMSNLAKANGTESFHFLQPNQYVPNAKPIGPEEADIVLKPQFIPYAQSVPTGYPLLQKAGKDLVKNGIHFEDLTYAFLSHPEPLYKDPCCHLLDAGSQILAGRIGATLQRVLGN